MKSAKTGTSMGGSLINTRSKKHYAITQKKDNQKIKRAKICIGCESNQEGYCNKHKEWCFKVNYICLDIKNPYEYKTYNPKDKFKNKKKSDKTNKSVLGLSSKDLKKTKQLRKQLEKNPEKTIKKLMKMNKIK